MFNEIMIAASEFLGNYRNTFSVTEDRSEITKYLSLGFDISPDRIIKIKTLDLPNGIPSIILADIEQDLEAGVRINDYGIYNGEITKIISFNRELFEKSDFHIVAMVLGLFGDICNTIFEYLRGLLNNRVESSASFTDILLYAPYVMSIAYLQNYYPHITDDFILDIYKSMYPKMTITSIASARRLITDYSIKDIFDNCIWYGVSHEDYPDIRCNSLPDNDWEESGDEGDDDFEF